MSVRPRVSVVMPCYKHEKYAGAAIESVRSQTITDWEIIAIDDCSPDATYSVLRQFVDPQIRISRHSQNAGAHATINEGVAMARGEWVAILNSDDLFARTRFEGLLERANRTSADVLGTDVALIDGHDRPLDDPTHYLVKWYDGLKKNLSDHGSIRRTLLNGNVFMTTSNMFFRKSFFDEVGPFRDLRYTHDYEWLLRALSAGHQLDFDASQRTISYRMHGSNTILEAPLKANQETLNLLLDHLELLLSEPDTDLNREYAEHVRRIVGYIEMAYHGELAALRSQLPPAAPKGLLGTIRGLLPVRR